MLSYSKRSAHVFMALFLMIIFFFLCPILLFYITFYEVFLNYFLITIFYCIILLYTVGTGQHCKTVILLYVLPCLNIFNK